MITNELSLTRQKSGPPDILALPISENMSDSSLNTPCLREGQYVPAGTMFPRAAAEHTFGVHFESWIRLQDYTPRDHPPFPDTLPNGRRHFLSIPMNAMVSGPTGGGPYFVDSPEDGASNPPRAISREWWERVCPEPRIFHLELHATNAELGIVGETDPAERMMRWGAKLGSIDAECVSVDGGSIFVYASSPRCRHHHICPLRDPQAASHRAMPPPHTPSPPLPRTARPRRRFRGCLGCTFAEAIMRGTAISWWTPAPITTRNLSYPALPDFLDVPQGMSRRDAAHAHCWPLPARIVERTRIVRAEATSGALFPAQKLTTVYISTNGEREWNSALVQLLRADGWERISTSLDMELAKDEYAVSQVVDVSILVSAETFIGVRILVVPGTELDSR
ncbi:hypothetical protein C8J57DRAFT_1247578 [Mycena rebaudengoi]|nr:hypothetical protein C8J57DRAFT_1247578 [Mycena rebaudengoi]